MKISGGQYLYPNTDTNTDTITVKCHSCGKEISVPSDFAGCVWCEQCMDSGDSQWSADATKHERIK